MIKLFRHRILCKLVLFAITFFVILNSALLIKKAEKQTSCFKRAKISSAVIVQLRVSQTQPFAGHGAVLRDHEQSPSPSSFAEAFTSFGKPKCHDIKY